MDENPYEAPNEAGYHTQPRGRKYDGSLGMALLSMGVGCGAMLASVRIVEQIPPPRWMGEYAGPIWMLGILTTFFGGTITTWLIACVAKRHSLPHASQWK